ncbi:MAG TPA: response regulator [Candidatus Dormibacteraeota bacterium]|nr:response regulator [Candidatus Dormibacteraeota bacterium]
MSNFSADVDGAMAAARAGLRIQPEHQMAAQEDHRRPLVVLVEDDDEIREMYSLGLELADFEVAGFADYSGVARLLDMRIPDVVVLDWQLSGFLTGADILINLRRDSRTEDTPVVFLSNFPSQIGRDGPAWLLKSETTPADLASRLRRVLRSPISQEIARPTQP